MCILGSVCSLAPSPPVIGSFLSPVFSSRNTNTNNDNVYNGNCFLSDMGQPRTEPSPCLTLEGTVREDHYQKDINGYQLIILDIRWEQSTEHTVGGRGERKTMQVNSE